ncbi:MAG: septal ring lytic transglycosylase RlpA family protein [Xanthomonadales bacterium]|nr:septal ring lytic transglycosylase RlpA family protein [Xanthomonadales bacterium]
MRQLLLVPVLMLMLMLMLMLAACGRGHVRDEVPPSGPGLDGAPTGLIDVSGIPEPVPRDEPRARYGNHSPYTVLGHSYRVLDSADGYRERGIASWYGTKFHGKLTSSREPYDMLAFTAAHKTLPLPTYVRVTNLDNGQRLIVRVNDRGPFHADRIIDLSYAAAIRLGIAARGTGRVEVEAIDPTHADAVDVTRPQTATPRPLYVQAGSFASRDNARRLRERLDEAGFDDLFLDRVLTRGELFHRVRIGPLDSIEAAEALIERLARIGVRAVATQVE